MAILTDENYVDKAENVITRLKKNRAGRYLLTTSKIRNLLSLTSTLFDESKVKRFDQLSDRIAYLRVQFVYQAGREDSVKRSCGKGSDFRGSKRNPQYRKSSTFLSLHGSLSSLL